MYARLRKLKPPESSACTSYSSDSDIELEKRDKLFKYPPRTPPGSVRFYFLCFFLAVLILTVILLITHALSFVLFGNTTTGFYTSSSQSSHSPDFQCSQIVKSRYTGSFFVKSHYTEISTSDFTMVLVGNFKEQEWRKMIRVIRPYVNDSMDVVVGISDDDELFGIGDGHVIGNVKKFVSKKKIVNAIVEEMQGGNAAGRMTVCSTKDVDESWRGLWRNGLVSEDFILFDGLGYLAPGWREWLKEARDAASVISLQGVQGTIVSRNRFGLASYIPGIVAISPLFSVWQEFLQDFDSALIYQRDQRRRGESHFADHAGMHRTYGKHATWARAFSQFAMRNSIVTLHADPALIHPLLM